MAQDVIVKKDGSTILAKVTKVGDREIEYKKFKANSDRLYSVNTSDVICINYEDGDQDKFDSKTLNNVNSSQSLKSKDADNKNKELLAIYNRIYKIKKNIDLSNKVAKYGLMIFGIKSNSIISNEDLEMQIVGKTEELSPIVSLKHYYIELTNKTDKTIYIDKANCFRIEQSGEYESYYDATEQTTVSFGGASGATIGLGGVARVLGIDGAVGQIASGVSIGGGSTHSVSTTYSQQRIIAIPPHAHKNLSENRWVETKKGNLFKDPSYKCIELAESFEYIRLKKGMVKSGEIIYYSEEDSPYTRDYIITYSKDENFSTYSTLRANVYLHQLIGNKSYLNYIDIEGLDKHTIEGSVRFSE